MSLLFHNNDEILTVYWDRSNFATIEDQLAAVGDSNTVYIGNLTFYTTEMKLTNIFKSVGPIKRVIMGINRLDYTPCGFAFVEFEKAFLLSLFVSCLFVCL